MDSKHVYIDYMINRDIGIKLDVFINKLEEYLPEYRNVFMNEHTFEIGNFPELNDPVQKKSIDQMDGDELLTYFVGKWESYLKNKWSIYNGLAELRYST